MADEKKTDIVSAFTPKDDAPQAATPAAAPAKPKKTMAQRHSDEIANIMAQHTAKVKSDLAVARWKQPRGWKFGLPLPKGWPAIPRGWSVANALQAKQRLKAERQKCSQLMKEAVHRHRKEANAV